MVQTNWQPSTLVVRYQILHHCKQQALKFRLKFIIITIATLFEEQQNVTFSPLINRTKVNSTERKFKMKDSLDQKYDAANETKGAVTDKEGSIFSFEKLFLYLVSSINFLLNKVVDTVNRIHE